MKLITFLLVISLNCYSQEIENLVNKDTIYFLVKEPIEPGLNKFESFNVTYYGKTKNSEMYVFKDNNNEAINLIVLAFHDTEKIKHPENFITSSKDFLQNHKSQIIDFEFIEKNGVETLLKIYEYRHNKTFYIIKEENLKKEEFILIHAFLNFMPQM